MNRVFARIFCGAILVGGAICPAYGADPFPAPRLNFGSPAQTPTPMVASPKPIVVGFSAETMVQALKAEREAYMRRLDICTQLRKVALDTQDDRLSVRALELEQIAEETYRERIARMGVKQEFRTASRPVESTLERTLGSGASVTPLTVAPPKPASAAAPETAFAPKRLSFREVPQQ